MKPKTALIIVVMLIAACNSVNKETETEQKSVPVEGTWKFLSGTTIKHNTNDTLFNDFTVDQIGIKIINASHFSFLRHDLDKGEGTPSFFEAGGGSYSLEGDTYVENLEYCSARKWEGIRVEFTAAVHADTLILTGIERNDSIGINQTITEKYLRVE